MQTFIFKTINEGRITELNDSQKNKVLKIFLNALFKSPPIFSYRGLSKAYLTERLSNKEETVDDSDMLCRLFYFGEKAKHFVETKSGIASRTWLNNLSDNSEKTASKIFEKIGNLRKSKNNIIKTFILENQRFFDFFHNNSNKDNFSQKIAALGSPARDYYISFLHRAGFIGMGNRSNAVSTSYSLNVAKDFVGDGPGYIIVSVIRLEHYFQKDLKSELLRNEMPVIHQSFDFYPDQLELTIRHGIFPHDIFGVIEKDTMDFIINPYIFNNDNSEVNIIDHPLVLDQSELEIALKENTRYSSLFYTYDREKFFENFIV